jgi:hypothetical protein
MSRGRQKLCTEINIEHFFLAKTPKERGARKEEVRKVVAGNARFSLRALRSFAALREIFFKDA